MPLFKVKDLSAKTSLSGALLLLGRLLLTYPERAKKLINKVDVNNHLLAWVFK